MVRRLLPGIGALVVIGLAARGVSAVIPSLNYLIVAIVIGLVIANSYGVPEWAKPGVGTHKLWLETGIVVMGAGIALDQVIAAGPEILLLVIGTVLATVVIIEILARAVFSIDAETGSLLAAGSGICGVSAVVAVAESIRADESRIAYAAATVLLFDATTLFVYPAVGHLLDLSDMVFGVWAGLTMFSTGPVTAAGFSYSQTAGHWALLVKLTRNALIGIAAVAYAIYYTRRSAGTGSIGGLTDLWRSFPKFIFGFLGVMIVTNLGLLSSGAIDSLSHASDWAFMLAFAGLGLEIDIGELRSTGYKPVLVVLVGLLAMSTTMLVVVGNVF